jgi:hypothetical protein
MGSCNERNVILAMRMVYLLQNYCNLQMNLSMSQMEHLAIFVSDGLMKLENLKYEMPSHF